MRILGIEGTAWAASAAVFETDDPDALTSATDRTPDPAADHVFIESNPYQPDSGGIHPREAAEHMGSAIPEVVETALAHAAERHDGDGPVVDAVAFSRGPGLGPCLRIVGTAARAVAQTLDVPLVGVNHMVAHLEIGRYQSGFESPVCLNASGANAHLLGYHNGRYRVLGETMDTGVGNSIDKFTRHVGWKHPGGPKVEAAAKDGDYVELPYVVKGMDFSFSGIMSAAKDEADAGTAVEDISAGLQETIFGMLTEVAERALSLTGTDELVLGGGVGNNARLREMLAEMCDQRGAKFHAPEPRFLGDNAGMIALCGARMFAAGDTLAVEESSVDPNFRPDQVDVTWRGTDESVARAYTDDGAIRGAEATVDIGTDDVVKRRVPKTYRHPKLDDRLRRERTKAEARLTSDARRAGVRTPIIHDIDPVEGVITFQKVGDADLAERLEPEAVRVVGEYLARLHDAGIVHGDPTTRNVRVGTGPDGATQVHIIDFGLGFHTGHVEDQAMDLHVFAQSVEGTAADAAPLLDALEAGYESVGSADVIARLREVESRGRYR
ncbi:MULTISPECIES: bifunctional N(6)-L-threonylcarbamoyladenine synthase/serine/threonine protein kinase [Haloferax]|uniref:Probable bifunctional tRNA threonylcarbamoyladenosine biosynthesis protein n=1 Tax=Haloferax marinum TaxID=2666143 RepID=A0A6A8G7F1_9EURY|nr:MULTISPECIES: bifunctional N(6)-L-threonylcarbamoyladenine synthase/serine/threonine protein kinase [Haloferax]KAB1198002.1 bifunctional N(6)-L-threonylcarbamoyladenine synthase/serine/threonine protein kinase [Haloferax sp. CBA1150]MRW97069.1 bifunctional N(6)-L-threonylcarbamoyladenine synthase/serine/threonine protein kinase [Haloferax marinum]